jgi:hypothetical protein
MERIEFTISPRQTNQAKAVEVLDGLVLDAIVDRAMEDVNNRYTTEGAWFLITASS